MNESERLPCRDLARAAHKLVSAGQPQVAGMLVEGNGYSLHPFHLRAVSLRDHARAATNCPLADPFDDLLQKG